jgi:hypothetical protein
MGLVLNAAHGALRVPLMQERASAWGWLEQCAQMHSSATFPGAPRLYSTRVWQLHVRQPRQGLHMSRSLATHHQPPLPLTSTGHTGMVHHKATATAANRGLDTRTVAAIRFITTHL